MRFLYCIRIMKLQSERWAECSRSFSKCERSRIGPYCNESTLCSSSQTALINPFTGTDFAGRALHCSAPAVWNALLCYATDSHSLATVKTRPIHGKLFCFVKPVTDLRPRSSHYLHLFSRCWALNVLDHDFDGDHVTSSVTWPFDLP